MLQGVAAGLLLCAVVLLAFMAFAKVEIETEGWCNSGDIKLDIEVDNIIQNKTCTKTVYNKGFDNYSIVPGPSHNGTVCFKEDYILKHAKLKGIDGLNCQGSAKVKMPLIMSWFMGDGY